ncbi:ATP-binding cassette domain-containing protein [Arachnia propionica]|uniref:ATP-binding cassette domain-containing protein n=1 Tax=Arachnia propionica TaxID=1750 RepID=A0A3P1T4F3_9ACTN|nr:ATP-binding cassette domain-containing protein [Arachnia propionica]
MADGSILNSSLPPLKCVGLGLEHITNGVERTIFHDLDVTVTPGDLLALAGRSGSGKTSLLRVLYGMQEPSAGTVWWGEQTLAALREKQRQQLRRECFGYASQDALVLEEETLETNVRLGGASREAARRYLDELGLGKLTRTRARTLSGGERQRVAVARALAKQPVVALLDEPTASLDAEAAHLVRDMLRTSAEQGVAVVVASHDEVILEAADQVVQL